jgi:uncharacterized protein with von Willebrand factor type A (vWA) domain
VTTSPTERRGSVPLDEVLSAVADERRRTVLRALDRIDGEVMEFDTLVDRVVERVRSDDGEPLDADERRRRVRTQLHHVHLPKLEACGLIVNDAETKRVRSDVGELGRELLTVVESYETRE